MRRYNYEEFSSDIFKIAHTLKDKEFDAVLFAARGGAFFAQALSYALGVRDMYAINCIGYNGKLKNNDLKLLSIPHIEPHHKNLLFVDEIIDSGDTLEAIKAAFAAHNLQFFSVALFQRPTAKISADLYLHNTNEWIEFFWEDFEAKK